MTNICFWLNSLSPHQMPYIQEMAKVQKDLDVFVIVPVIDSRDRKKMGWDSMVYLENNNVQIIIKPSIEKKRELFQLANSYHFFSGISSFADVYESFKLSVQYAVKRGIITEGPTTFRKPLWMHYVRFLIQDYRYVKHIDFVFAIGNFAVKYYQNISKKWKVIPFSYCTARVERLLPINSSSLIKIIYVGSLSPWKDVETLLESIKLCSSIPYQLTVVGDGRQKESLRQYVEDNQMNVSFVGYKTISEVQNLLQQQDILILPSLYDGWGAVVNEALTLGLYVIASDACGASKLLKEDKRIGLVFPKKSSKSLANKLRYVEEKIHSIRRDSDYRISWSQENISPEASAQYFLGQINV